MFPHWSRCDYRRPTIDRLLGVPARRGSPRRHVDRPTELSEIVHKTEWPDLWAAPSGRPTPVAGCAGVAGEIISAACENGVSV
jgi:hypothetical protein